MRLQPFEQDSVALVEIGDSWTLEQQVHVASGQKFFRGFSGVGPRVVHLPQHFVETVRIGPPEVASMSHKDEELAVVCWCFLHSDALVRCEGHQEHGFLLKDGPFEASSWLMRHSDGS